MKLTIDLEQELLNQNVSVNKQEELILAQFKDILTEGADADQNALEAAGFSSSIQRYHNTTRSNANRKALVEKYGKERLFTQDQIRAIAIRYGLRFLPSSLYKGAMDAQLPAKIREFQELSGGYGRHNYYILAPKSSFELQQRPKDPLLFARVDGDLFYLVHKWGNDLSVGRYLVNLPIRYVNLYVVLVAVALLTATLSVTQGDAWYNVAGFIILMILTLISAVAIWAGAAKGNIFFWDENFKD